MLIDDDNDIEVNIDEIREHADTFIIENAKNDKKDNWLKVIMY